MRSSMRHKGGPTSRGPGDDGCEPSDLGQPSRSLLRNAPPEPRKAEQPGTGSPSPAPVKVTIRRRGRWRTRSGRVRRDWELAFEPTAPTHLDPVMGWTQSSDPLGGHKVAFHTAESAIAFARRKGWGVQVIGDGLSADSGSPDIRPAGARDARPEGPFV